MYLRCTIRKKDGKVHRYWRLVRGVRVGRRVIQQTVGHLGELDEEGRIAVRARHVIGVLEQAQSFDDGSRDVPVPVRRCAIVLLKNVSRSWSNPLGQTGYHPNQRQFQCQS
jgi:hypothetical protein